LKIIDDIGGLVVEDYLDFLNIRLDFWGLWEIIPRSRYRFRSMLGSVSRSRQLYRAVENLNFSDRIRAVWSKKCGFLFF